MTQWTHASIPGYEVNLVFSRGLSADALSAGLRAVPREPLAVGEAGGWAWAVHEMFDEESDDYAEVDYRRLCPDGTELVVLVTEPCSAKAHAPQVLYLRDGRTILFFTFEDLEQRMGENPDYMSAELLAANLIGPGAECDTWQADDDHDCFDHHDRDEDRVMKAIQDCFGLPPLPLGPTEAVSK